MLNIILTFLLSASLFDVLKPKPLLQPKVTKLLSPVNNNKKRKSCDVSPYQKSSKCAKSEDGVKVLRADESENEVSSSSEPDASKHVAKETKTETKASKVGSLDRFVQITQATEVSTSCEIDPVIEISSESSKDKSDLESPTESKENTPVQGSSNECKENTPVQEGPCKSKENSAVDKAKVDENGKPEQSKEEQTEKHDDDNKSVEVLSSPEGNKKESNEESPTKQDGPEQMVSTPVASRPPRKAVSV